MDVIAQTVQAADAVPAWVGGLSGTALTGVLLYYLITNALPKMQDRFHEALEKERESREKMSERTFQEHREAIKAIIEKDEKRCEHEDERHRELIARIDSLPGMLRPQV